MTAPPEVPAGFGAALYELRKARGWSMLRAAGAAGVSTSVVARAERGGNVGLAQAIRMATAYETTVGKLLDGTAEVPAGPAREVPARSPGSGRRQLLDDAQAATVRRMYAVRGPDGRRRHTVLEIAEGVGVARSTVYGYLRDGAEGRT